MTICAPPGTDWSCAFSASAIAEMQADQAKVHIMDRSEAFAWMTLASLTADQIGTCPITVRPCAASCYIGSWLEAPALGATYPRIGRTAAFTPYISSTGAWVNGCGCASRDLCSCGALSSVTLPGPIGDIVEVWLNGEVLPASSYRVDNGNILVRTDGEQWPGSQNLSQDAHGAEAFSVTYYRGAAPDAVLLCAAGVLAAEYYKAYSGDKTCRLPRNVQTVTRQGVSMELQTDFSEVMTRIPEVAAVVNRYNPNGLKMPPVVASPQSRRTRQTTWSV